MPSACESVRSPGRVSGDGRRRARLAGVHLGVQLNMEDAHLTNQSGPALNADRIHVAGGAFLDGDFRASGAGERGPLSDPHPRAHREADRRWAGHRFRSRRWTPTTCLACGRRWGKRSPGHRGDRCAAGRRWLAGRRCQPFRHGGRAGPPWKWWRPPRAPRC